jgi:hypothetical protein
MTASTGRLPLAELGASAFVQSVLASISPTAIKAPDGEFGNSFIERTARNTSCPFEHKASQSAEPMNPDDPVTRTRNEVAPLSMAELGDLIQEFVTTTLSGAHKATEFSDQLASCY